MTKIHAQFAETLHEGFRKLYADHIAETAKFFMIEKLKERIKKHEGFRSHGYMDSLGYMTIGWGHLIDARKGGSIDEDILEMVLDRDIAKAWAQAETLVDNFDHLSDERKGVLVEMVFQMGFATVRRFKHMRRAVEAKDWDAAADEMLDSMWAAQTPGRAKKLADIMRRGY